MRRLSLKQKLPLLICGLLLGVVLLDSALSYRSVETAALAVGRERLRSVTDQLGDLLDKSIVTGEKNLHVAASDGAVVRFLRTRSESNRAPALAALRKTTPTSAQRIVGELYDAQHHLVLSGTDGASTPLLDASTELAQAAVPPRYYAVGRMRIDRDTIVVPVVAAIVDNGSPVGFYLEWRRIATAPAQRDQLLRLIGPNTALLVGNDDGGIWTDLAGAVPAPKIDLKASNSVVEYKRADGSPVFAAARAIAGSPWVVVIELSGDAILASANDFLKRSAVIGLVLVALGFLLAWAMSRSITQPLKHLTDASMALAAGDLSQSVAVERSDELGQLAMAFNIMAGRVRESTQTLEHRVEERTVRLEQLQIVMLRTERLNTLATLGAGLAHDLNNLIFTISLADQQLQLEAAAGRTASTHLLTRIATATSGASRITKRLMQFARGEGGSSAPVELNIGAEVAAHQDLLRMLLPRTIGLRLQIEETTHTLTLPASLIEQTLVNLVSNARDAMPDGGQVTVTVREECDSESSLVILEVSDTGPGIPVELQKEIFDTFFTTKAELGTGIGLASVRALMTSVGGSVTVHCKPGEGATFRLLFPIEREASELAGSSSH